MAAPTLDWAPPEATADVQPQTWQPPEALEPTWAPPEALETPAPDWTPPEAQQSPLETGVRTIGKDVSNLAMSGVSGLGRWFENLSGAANEVVPGLGDVLDYAPQSALFQNLAPVAQDLQQAAQDVYQPDAERNPIAATIGSGIGQAIGTIPLIATGGTPLVLGAAAASGFGEGSQTAEDLGIQSPSEQMALGVGFGLAETAVERLGGIGAGPVRAAGQEAIQSLAKRTLGTIGSEAIEEPITGALQDAGSLIAARSVADPNRPGFTTTGESITALQPSDPAYWTRRGQEALGGAVGGTVFAGLGLLADRQRPTDPATPTTPTSPTLNSPLSTSPTITLNGTAYTYNPNELTPDQIQTIAATGNLQDYLDAGMVQNATPQTPLATPGTPDPANVGPPPPPMVDTPGPSIQEARETLGDIGNVGTRAAPATTVGRAGPAPLPRDPDGNLDLLNYLNENPIRAPRRGTEGSAAAEYDWRESGDFDPAYRTRIMQEGAPNIDQRAQEAFDLGFIPAPTPEALANEVRSVIAKRQQQRQQGPAQSKIMDEMERAQIAFDRTQERLASTGQPVNLDDLAPGDTLRIDGQPITVADIEYDEDGYTTRALLRTPTGTVRVTPETNLRADRPAASAPLDLEDLNAQLALAAEANQGFTNTTIVATRQDGSTILYPELVDLAARALTAGTRFTTWAANLVKQFGQAIKQYLAGAWQAAKNNSEVGARANLNPNARISARPPTMAEAIEGQTRESQFGQRVQADERLTDPLRAAPVSTFAVQTEQQAEDAATALIRDLGLDAATAQFTNDASLPMPVRIAGLMKAALQYDARAALAQRQNNPTASATADAATAAAIEAKAQLEIIGNETGRNLAMFRMWARMSPDGQLRRLDRQFDTAARDTIRGDTGVTPEEVNTLVIEETAKIDIFDLIEEVKLEGPTPVNLQTGAPIARRSLFDTFLGGIETVARGITESRALQITANALDRFIKALDGKLFSDPFLLTPAAQAILKTTRALLLQGTKLTQAIADAIAVVRTRTPIPAQDIAPLTQAVTSAVVKEVIRPILRKLAFDPAYNKREATKDMLAIGIGVMEAGRLADAVIAKRPKIAKAAQDIVRQRVMRRLSDKPRSKSRRQKLPAILDTLTLAAANGFINERTFLNAWDAKHPLPKLTPADRQRLRQMAAAVNLLPEGVLRQAEAIKFLNEVALIEGIPTSDLLVATWYANILSGMSTQAVNVWGNAFNLALRTLAIGLTSPADFAKLNLGLTKGLQPGLREAREVLRTGNLLKVGKMDDMQKAAALELMMAQGGPRGFGQWLSYLLSVGGLTRFVFRAMGATDAVFWYSAQEGMAHAAASRLIRKTQGLKPGTPQFNAEFIRQLGGDEQQFLADMDQARTELNAAGVPVTPGAVNRRAYEIRVQRRSLTLRDASTRWADRVVMQQQPEGSGAFISWIIGGLQRFRLAGVPIFLPLAPFNRIVSNVFESSLDFAGVGILRGILGSHLSELHDPKRIRFDNLERAERFGAGVIGLTAAGFLLSMAMAVKDQDDEEVPFMVYAMGPPDPTRKGLMPKGWRPFTMKIGKNYVGFAETPLGPLLGAVGGWLDSVRYGKAENKTLTERGLLAFLHAVNSFNSMGALSTIKELGELFQSQGSLRAAKQATLSPVPGFIPAQGFMRDVATIMDDTKISDAEVFGALVKDIPVLKAYGKPALNVLGEEIKLEGTPIVRRFTNKQRPDDNIAYIQKHKLRISALPRTIEIGKYLPARTQGALDLATSDQRRALGITAVENGVMTPDQQFQFTKTQGEKIKEGLIRLRKSTANIPPSPQATKAFQTQLDAIAQAARQTAMLQIIQDLR